MSGGSSAFTTQKNPMTRTIRTCSPVEIAHQGVFRTSFSVVGSSANISSLMVRPSFPARRSSPGSANRIRIAVVDFECQAVDRGRVDAASFAAPAVNGLPRAAPAAGRVGVLFPLQGFADRFGPDPPPRAVGAASLEDRERSAVPVVVVRGEQAV